MKTKIILPALLCSVLGLAGCQTEASGTFPALKLNNLESKTTRLTTNVVVAAEFSEDGEEIEAVNVTAFGRTFRITEDNSFPGPNDRSLLAEIDGTTIILNTPFESIFDAVASLSGDKDAKTRFNDHVAGFVITFETPEGVVVGLPEAASASAATDPVRTMNDGGLPRGEPEIANIATFVGGEATDPDKVGAFAIDPKKTGDAKAIYQGSARIIDAPSDNPLGVRTIDGRIELEANFSQGTIGGNINRLTVTNGVNVFGEPDGPNIVAGPKVPNGNLPIFVNNSVITDTIRVNETEITGNTFSTDLDLLRDEPKVEPTLVPCFDCGGPKPTVVEGFFSDSQVDGTFFGPQGEEIGGTIAYTREGEYNEVDLGVVYGKPKDERLNDNVHGGQVIIPGDPSAPAEAIGVFSADAGIGGGPQPCHCDD